MNAEAAHLIETQNLSAIRPLLEKLSKVPTAGSHTMNDDLTMLINAKRVDLVDARKGTTDPLKFAEMFERAK